MSTDEFGERTEQPTERRRTQARGRGNVARSVDLTAAGLLLGAAVAFYMLAIPLCRTLADMTRGMIRGAGTSASGRPTSSTSSAARCNCWHPRCSPCCWR